MNLFLITCLTQMTQCNGQHIRSNWLTKHLDVIARLSCMTSCVFVAPVLDIANNGSFFFISVIE